MRNPNETQPRVRSWQEFESTLPKGWKIEPVNVGVEKNDIELGKTFEAFKTLVELSGIDKTLDELFKELNVEELTNSNWEQIFLLSWTKATPFQLMQAFINRYYALNYAYIKVWDKIIKWRIETTDREYKMKTSKWIITMPSLCVVNGSERNYVFFPIKAIISEDEESFYSLYWQQPVEENERHTIETQIMNLLAKLSNCHKQQTILETNSIWEKIEELCRNSGTVKKVYIQNGMLKMDFNWRKVVDTDDNYVPMVLPPCIIGVDLRNYVIRGSAREHPHILSDNTLCLGGTLTDLAQKCIQDKDIYTLVGWLIQFANSWTSSDADQSWREPAYCIKNWLENHYSGDTNWEEIFEKAWISKEDVKNTIENNLWEDSFYYFSTFQDFIWANE